MSVLCLSCIIFFIFFPAYVDQFHMIFTFWEFILRKKINFYPWYFSNYSHWLNLLSIQVPIILGCKLKCCWYQSKLAVLRSQNETREVSILERVLYYLILLFMDSGAWMICQISVFSFLFDYTQLHSCDYWKRCQLTLPH